MAVCATIAAKEAAGQVLSAEEKLLMENAADTATQNARLEALNGKVCLWVTAPVIPMMSGTMLGRVKWVRSQGVKICAVFHSPEDKLYSIMKENELFDQAIFADLKSKNEGDKILQAILEAGVQVNSVFSPYEQCQTIVGDVATKLNLQANPAAAYSIARSKDRTRQALTSNGIPTPRSGVASTRDELMSVMEHVGYPAILKPSSGAGSAGVFRANTFEEAEKAFEAIINDLEKNNNLNWNPGVERNTCLVEELLVGAEFDVDILMWDSKPVYIRTVDNWECIPPYFLETGSNMPSLYPRDKVEILEKYAVDCALACGFTFGCFHVECIYTEEGPRLIEVNARQGGGCMQEFNQGMHDVDIFANFFISTFGIPINPPVTPQKCAMADYSITCSKTGRIANIDFTKQLEAHPNVVRCTSFVKPGDKVVGFDTGFPMWLGEFVVQGETAEDCVKLINDLVSGLNFDIQPLSEEDDSRVETTDAPIDKPSSKDSALSTQQTPEEDLPTPEVTVSADPLQ